MLGLSLAFILSQDQTLRCMNCFFLVSLRSCALYEPLVLTYISICPVLPRKLQMFSKISIFWRRTLSRAAYFVASVSASVSFLPESECKSIADFDSVQAFRKLFFKFLCKWLILRKIIFKEFLPWKRRITASPTSGRGIYFFSTHETGGKLWGIPRNRV